MTSDIPKLDPREQHFRIPGPHPPLKLFLRHLPALHRADTEPRPVLYVHGATFPSALSVAHRFDGFSWRDALSEAGFESGRSIFTGSAAPIVMAKWDSRPRTMPRCATPGMPAGRSRRRRVSFSSIEAARDCRWSRIRGGRCRRVVLPESIRP